jgi:O-antigen/teichoic acid export membrane protein
MFQMSIAYGGIVAFLFRGVNLLVALVTLYVTASQLGVDGRGTFVVGTTIVGMVAALTGGITASAAYQISNQRREPGVVLLNGSLLAAGLAAIAITAGLAGWQVASGDWRMIAPAAGTAAGAVVLVSVISGVFLGREALVRYNLALVVPPFLALVGVLFTLFVLGHKTPAAALTAFAIGQWAAVPLLVLLGSRTLLHGMRLEAALAATLFRFAFLAGIASVLSYFNYRADTFVVKHFEGSSGVGVYSSAVLLTEAVWQFSGSLALAAYARVGGLDRHAAAVLTTRVMRHTLVILSAVCAGLFIIAPVLVGALPPSFAGASTALRLLLPGTLLYGLGAALSGFYTYQRGMPWVSAAIASTGLVLDIALDFVLIPPLGVNGAALASSIAYTVAIFGALAIFMWDTREGFADVFRFGRADVDDYRTLITRLRAAVGR